MDEKNLITGVLTKTLNLTEEEVSDLLYQKADDSDEVTLKDDALNLVLDHDVKRVDNIKSNVRPSKKALQAEYDKGVFDAMSKLEGSLRESYEVESDAKGIDLVKEIVHTVSECSKEITDDDIKNHELYRKLEAKKSKDDYEKLQKEFDDYKSNQDKISTLSTVKRDVLSIFTQMQPVESQNATIAQNRRADFLNKFEGYDYELADDSNHFVLKEGKRVEDKHGNPLRFAEFVKDIASKNYEFAEGTDGGNAENTSDGKQTTHTKVPKTKEDYLEEMVELIKNGTPEDRVKLTKAWEESQKK